MDHLPTYQLRISQRGARSFVVELDTSVDMSHQHSNPLSLDALKRRQDNDGLGSMVGEALVSVGGGECSSDEVDESDSEYETKVEDDGVEEPVSHDLFTPVREH